MKAGIHLLDSAHVNVHRKNYGEISNQFLKRFAFYKNIHFIRHRESVFAMSMPLWLWTPTFFFPILISPYFLSICSHKMQKLIIKCVNEVTANIKQHKQVLKCNRKGKIFKFQQTKIKGIKQ